MKKILLPLAAAALVASSLAADWIVLKDGTRYETVGKLIITGNQATFTLKNGQMVQVAAEAVDRAKSEEATRLNGGRLLAIEQAPSPAAKPQPSLGSRVRLRPVQPGGDAPVPTPVPVAPTSSALLGADVVAKFERAYENVGIFEHKMTALPGRALRADLTTDNEEKVFNAISATAFLIVKNAGLTGVTIDEVDMYMKMTNGGTAGRFHMTRADAGALYAGGTAPDRAKLVDYFIRKVLF
jgi:hypothetical protein